MVFAFGWTLLMEKDGHRHGTAEAAVPRKCIFHRAFYPLTLPLTIGPGAISVAITVGAHTSHNYGVHVSIILAALLAMGLVAASIFLCYRCADWLWCLNPRPNRDYHRYSPFFFSAGLHWGADHLEWIRGSAPGSLHFRLPARAMS